MKKPDIYKVLLWIIIAGTIIMFVLSGITLKRHFDAQKALESETIGKWENKHPRQRLDDAKE